MNTLLTMAIKSFMLCLLVMENTVTFCLTGLTVIIGLTLLAPSIESFPNNVPELLNTNIHRMCITPLWKNTSASGTSVCFVWETGANPAVFRLVGLDTPSSRALQWSNDLE